MADLMKTVREACRSKKLDIPELKTVEGAVALSECMDIMTGLEGEGCDYERAGYAATALIKWTDSLPLEVFQKDGIGIPAILERIRKIYDGDFFEEGHQTPLLYTDYYGCTSRSFVKFVSDRMGAWKLPYDYKKVKALKENGYSFAWYSYSYNDVETRPNTSWCDLLRLFPQKSDVLVYSAIRMKRRDILECMKEIDALPTEKIVEVKGNLKGEERELFCDVFCKEQGHFPEVDMVMDLLAAEKPNGQKIGQIISGSPEAFHEEYTLVKKAIDFAPCIILSGDWSSDKAMYEAAFAAMETYYIDTDSLKYRDLNIYYTHAIFGRNSKENKDIWIKAFKTHYPTDEDKRAFLRKYPACALAGGFYAACPKKIKDDLAFWVDVYAHDGCSVDPPVALLKNQAFLRMCAPVKPIRDFSKFFKVDSQECIEFALSLEKLSIRLSTVPEELRTYENIYRILEHTSCVHPGCLYEDLDAVDVALFADEEFVVGAAAYQISAYNFFARIDKPLRKVERVWKAWGTKDRIGDIQGRLPFSVKQSRIYIEHLLAIGNGVFFEGDVFAEAWKKFPDLAEALEDEYVKELSEYKDSRGCGLEEYEKKRKADDIPDEKLREIVSKKLFG